MGWGEVLEWNGLGWGEVPGWNGLRWGTGGGMQRPGVGVSVEWREGA